MTDAPGVGTTHPSDPMDDSGQVSSTCVTVVGDWSRAPRTVVDDRGVRHPVAAGVAPTLSDGSTALRAGQRLVALIDDRGEVVALAIHAAPH